jgi:hypothetical protein
MTNRLMISVAAIALIAGAGFANAQGNMGHEGGGAAGGAAAQSAPAAGGADRGGADRAAPGGADRAGSAGQMNHNASPSEMQKSPGAANGQRADDNMQGSKSKSMSSENADKANADQKNGGKDMKAEGREQNGNTKDAQGTERNNMRDAQGNERNGDRKMNNQAEGRTDRDSKTVGQAGAGAKLTTEQRTRVTTVIRDQHVAPVTNVNFNISVGTRVPREGVSFHPLPTEIVNVYPDWRGYEFILVRDQILVINPDSLEIVAVLDA